MAIVTVAGDAGCRCEDLARAAAARMAFELITESRLDALIREEFGGVELPDKAWPPAAIVTLARAARERHLVVSAAGAERLFRNVNVTLRVFLSGRLAHRTGNLMLDLRLDRAAAAAELHQRESAGRSLMKSRFGKTNAPAEDFDLAFNAESFEPDQMAELIQAAVTSRGLLEDGLLSAAAESQLQFQARLQLAGFGIAPAGVSSIKQKPFGHPSEELFANLLDFYRIAWEYEPRSFPLQWDKEGKVMEAFTPDFYLPDFDLYVELTTMKQSLVTKKNRKVKLLRAIYPHVNIRVFYQKDFQDLVSKHGLSERTLSL